MGEWISHDFASPRVMRACAASNSVLIFDGGERRICGDMQALGEKLLDINAVAEYLGVSEDTVRRMIDRGLLPVVQFAGSRGHTIRIRPETLQRTLSRWEQRTR